MNFFRKNLSTNRRSQIAVIITFVIAVIFLFIAVFINISKVSQVKTTTSTAADRAALSLASQLGSMSHYYKDKVLKISGACPEPCQLCGLSDWVPLAAFIITAIATGIAAFVFFPAVVVGAALGAANTVVLSSMVLGGINTKFREMSGYNAMRESALFQSLSATQSDDVELKAKTPGSGVFYEDLNNNGVFDTGEPVYNLRAIPEMLNEKKVSRFLAWYYTKRLPLVSDESMKDSLAVFLIGIRGFIDGDERDSSHKIIKLSFWITPKSGDRNYEVTCSSSSCPNWVKDVGTGQLRIVRMDSSDAVYGGFLKDKLSSLLSRLDTKYNGIFCAKEGCKIKPSDLNTLIQDLRIFLLRSKELLNQPVSERLSSLPHWYPLFYNPTKHKADSRESIDGNNDYDIYLRLSRDYDFINTMINELETLNNNTIRPNIVSDQNTHCQEGQGYIAGYCMHHGGPGCWPCWYSSNGVPAHWYGIYGTCTGQSDHSAHPVCINGDLYGKSPDWCNVLKGTPPCNDTYGGACPSPCPPPPPVTTIDKSYYFQGQLSWRTPATDRFDGTDKPTEVEQAIRILRALEDDLGKIKMYIKDLAEAAIKQLPSHPYEPYTDTNGNGIHDDGEPFYDLNHNGVYDTDLPEFRKRTEIVYAWKDKLQYSHLVRVKIDGYPDNLPNVTESVTWTGMTTCRRLNNYQGDFKITTSRYDQDQPTDIAKWQLRRRRTEKLGEFDKTKLETMVGDIQNCGILNNPCVMPLPGCALSSGIYTDVDVDDLLKNYAITSCSQAHYGPEKSDIYIKDTKCN